MRACLVLILWCVACSQRYPAASTTSADDPAPPAPAVPDAGPVAAPAPDAGPAPIVADPPDASSQIPPAPPPAIPAARCEAAPQLLWSRTISTSQASFVGAADRAGNVYWTETDPPASWTDPPGPTWLASAEADGNLRYRAAAPGAGDTLFVAGDRVIASKAGVIEAHDAATGIVLWSDDLTHDAGFGYDTRSGGVVDLGDGTVAFALWTTMSTTSRIFLIDVASGAVRWSKTLDSGALLRSNGAGTFMVSANRRNPPPSYDATADFSIFDSAGVERWTVRLSDTRYYGSQLLAWPDVPWLTAFGVQRISPGNGYVAAPEAWGELVLSGNSGFAITTVSHALAIEQIQRGAVVGEAVLPDLASVSAGVAAFPMLAGSGDRLLLVAQVYSGSSGLCHVVTAGKASIVRIDSGGAAECPLTLQGESRITGAKLFPGRLVLGRVDIVTTACTNPTVVFPVHIEAYAMSGE